MRSLLLFAALLVTVPVWAATPRPEILDARALAMGGALRTLSGPVAAARMNPAALGAVRGFFAGTSYATRRADACDALSFTLVDNVTSPLGGALQYLRLQSREEREDMSLSLAGGKSGIWWGFTIRYVHGRQRNEAEWHDVFTGDLGLLFQRPGGLRIAVVGHDLMQTPLDFLDRRVALAVSKDALWGWAVEADVVRNLDQDFGNGLDFHVGAEYAVGGTPWKLRLGQFWRGDTAEDYASAGVGWSWENIALAYAVQKTRQEAGEFLHAFSIDGSF